MESPSLTKTWHTTSYPAISPTNSSLSVAGKVVFITGGNSGIGLATAHAFAAAGASKIFITGRTSTTLHAAQKAIQALHPNVSICPAIADVTDQNAMHAVYASLSKVDILVNNAGYLPDVLSIANSSLEDWWSAFEIHVKGSFIVTQEFLKVAAPGAVLINVTTGIAQMPALPYCSGYAASKLAQLKFFDCVQVENPELHVVNVHPGTVPSGTTRKAINAAGYFEMEDISLSAHFIVWAASLGARFLKGKTVWANWDVDEMKAMEAEIKGSSILTTTLDGMSAFKYTRKPGSEMSQAN